jgi:hypothetical protein
MQSLTVVRLHVKITADILAYCSCGWGIPVDACFFFSDGHFIAFSLLIKTSCFESRSIELVNNVLL